MSISNQNSLLSPKNDDIVGSRRKSYISARAKRKHNRLRIAGIQIVPTIEHYYILVHNTDILTDGTNKIIWRA